MATMAMEGAAIHRNLVFRLHDLGFHDDGLAGGAAVGGTGSGEKPIRAMEPEV